MSVDIRGIEVALVKTVRAAIGDKLSTIGNGLLLWQSIGFGTVTNPSHVFIATDKPTAEADRDSYFASNPLELVQGVQATIGYPLVDPTLIIQEYNTKASVIRSRLYSEGSRETTPTFPDYPYASVDYTRITDEGYELTARFYDENENYVYQTHKLAAYSVKIFGTSKDDILGICNELHMKLEIDGFRTMIEDFSPTEARLRSKSDIVFVASAMEDKYREVASFDVILAVLDEVSVDDTVVPPIENIILDTSVPQEGIQGGLDKDGDGTPEPHLDVYVETDVTYP